MNDNKSFGAILGLADIFAYNLLLLIVLPAYSSLTTTAWIAFGCIISVQIGDICTGFMFYYYDNEDMPGLPLPVIAVFTYTVVLDAIMQYSSSACEDALKWKEKTFL
jgi:hypothetical protein